MKIEFQANTCDPYHTIMEMLLQNIVVSAASCDLFQLVDMLNNKIKCNNGLVDCVASHLVDTNFLDEVQTVVRFGNVGVYFGKTLRDIKIVIQNDEGLRDHEIFIQYKAPKKLVVTNVNLPHSALQNREYRTLDEVIETFRKYVNDLSHYFYQLENIDQHCTIMEPVKATFKDTYRRILLDARTWLHVEVTPEGLATNIHLVGQSVHWHNKLQTGLLSWDHDKNIVENIIAIFDLEALPQLMSAPETEREDKTEDTVVCGICLCAELPEDSSIPQPLCQNVTCGVYYHRSCLYQWLVACAGSRPPAFGVANGACPTCLQPITCSEKDN